MVIIKIIRLTNAEMYYIINARKSQADIPLIFHGEQSVWIIKILF